MYLLYKYIRTISIMKLEIIVRAKPDRPIYEQIQQQIQNAIAQGILKPGDPLPSMRGLARQLSVSVITVQKAYENLSRDGFIISAVGKGSVVAAIEQEEARNQTWKSIDSLIEQAARQADEAGFSKKELLERIEKLIQ